MRQQHGCSLPAEAGPHGGQARSCAAPVPVGGHAWPGCQAAPGRAQETRQEAYDQARRSGRCQALLAGQGADAQRPCRDTPAGGAAQTASCSNTLQGRRVLGATPGLAPAWPRAGEAEAWRPAGGGSLMTGASCARGTTWPTRRAAAAMASSTPARRAPSFAEQLCPSRRGKLSSWR